MNSNTAVDLFLLSRQAKGLSPKTIKWYRDILKRFVLANRTLPRRPEPIERFLINCPGFDERRHGYYRALKALYRFLQRRYLEKNPMDLVEPPRRVRKQPRFLMLQDIHSLLSYPDHPQGTRAALMFLIDTGARLGELTSVDLDSLDESPNGFICTINGKTGTRVVPVSYETYHALMVMDASQFHRKTDWIGRRISKAFKDAGVRGTAITLRHTFGTLWKGDELALQRIMGHSNLATTKLYRHWAMDHLIQQHHQYSPLRMVMGATRNML